MRCIFCKNNSDSSKSEEHIVPESLGNKSNILPKGVVCDNCNNYFATKVEKFFLEADALSALRFHQSIPSKRGRIPPLEGILTPDIPTKMYKSPNMNNYIGVLDLPIKGVKHILEKREGELIFPYSQKPPDDFITSRFLAKMAVEVLAQRLMVADGGLEYLISETQFDPIRLHAREGRIRKWPFNVRRVYSADRKIFDQTGEPVQTVYEYDILQTPQSEYYFIFILFGLELVINFGGPEIEGYEKWLKKNNNACPLYL